MSTTESEAAELGVLLSNFISPDETERKQAEALFNKCKEQDPSKLLVLLVAVLRRDADGTRRSQAAIAIRTFFRGLIRDDPETNLWPKLQYDVQNSFKTEILAAIEAEPSGTVRNAIADVVSDVGGALVEKALWPELPQVVCQMAACSVPAVSALGLKVMGELLPKTPSTFSSQVNSIADLVYRKLGEPDSNVQVECVGVIGQFVEVETRAVWKVFQKTVPVIIPLLQKYSVEDEDVAQNILRTLIEIGDSDPELFKPNIQGLLESCLLIARNPKSADDTRQLAIELVITILENKQGMCLKVPNFLDVLVSTLMELMLCIEDDWEWMDRERSAEEDEETRNYDVGEGGLDRVGGLLPPEKFMPVVFKKVAEFSARPGWADKVAAIMTINQTVEYLDTEDIEPKLDEITKFLLAMLNDPHPRVRYAACQAIGQVSLDQQPLFQELYTQEVLQALIAAFDDPVARVQGHSISAFVNFTEEVDAEEFLPLADLVMEKFLTRLTPAFTAPADPSDSAASIEVRTRTIREHSVTAVAVVAGVLESKFISYYNTVVPLMKSIASSATSHEERNIRGKSLECLSVICFSVGMDICKHDTSEVIRGMISLYHEPLSEDNPIKDYLHEGLRRLIKIVGKDFQPFVNDILPKLLQDASVQPEIVDLADPDYTFVSIAEEGKFKGIKTSAIDEVEKSVMLITVIIEALKGNFGPNAEVTMARLLPLLEFQFSDTVRRVSLTCIAELLSASREANLPIDKLQSWVTSIVDFLFKSVSETEETNAMLLDVEEMTANIGGLAQCIESAGEGVLYAQHVSVICEKVFSLLNGSAERRAELAAAKHEPDLDDEDKEKLEEEQQREQTFRSTLFDTTRALMKNYGALFIDNGAAMCLQFVKAYSDPKRSAEDKALALYVIDDILEQLGPLGYPLWPQLMEFLIVSITDPDAPVRQAAGFGCKFVCSRKDTDQTYLYEIVKRLNQVILDPKAKKKDNKSACENAISAMVCCLEHHPEIFGTDFQKQISILVENLPLKVDASEAQDVHGKVVKSLLELSSPFYGAEFSNLPHLMRMFGSVYKSDMSTSETDSEILKVVSVLGSERASQAALSATLTKGQQKCLEKVFRDASKPPALISS